MPSAPALSTTPCPVTIAPEKPSITCLRGSAFAMASRTGGSESLPPALDAVASALPLRHLIDGFSGAIVTGQGLVDNAGALGIVAGWGALGLLLAVRGFRWE